MSTQVGGGFLAAVLFAVRTVVFQGSILVAKQVISRSQSGALASREEASQLGELLFACLAHTLDALPEVGIGEALRVVTTAGAAAAASRSGMAVVVQTLYSGCVVTHRIVVQGTHELFVTLQLGHELPVLQHDRDSLVLQVLRDLLVVDVRRSLPFVLLHFLLQQIVAELVVSG